MSRAYRISVRESERRVVRAEDSVATRLGMLEVLSREEMAALLEQELVARGFRKTDSGLRREADGIVVTVDPNTGEVIARSQAEEKVEVASVREGLAYDDIGPTSSQVRDRLKDEARQSLQSQADVEAKRLQVEVTDRLERELIELKPELERAVNRATAEALKRRAAQLGQVKAIEEDAATGAVTIRVEV